MLIYTLDCYAPALKELNDAVNATIPEAKIRQFNEAGTALDAISDGDGIVTILDATNIQRYLAQYPVSNPEITVKCGNINGDGLDIMDATRIQRFLAQYPDPYGIGELII